MSSYKLMLQNQALKAMLGDIPAKKAASQLIPGLDQQVAKQEAMSKDSAKAETRGVCLGVRQPSKEFGPLAKTALERRLGDFYENKQEQELTKTQTNTRRFSR